MQYKKNRQLANQTNARIRRTIKKVTGHKLSKKLEIDETVPIKRGGSPTKISNKRIVPRTVNRRKGTK